MSTEVTTIEETTESAGYLAPQASLAISLARSEIDQQIATARALPRSIQRAVSNITTLATLDEETAAECIYALPRGGKTIKGPSIRFAEIMASQWGNCRIAARVVHVDKIEGYVEAEGVFHDLETNVAQMARVRRTIQAKRGKGIDADMIQLASAAAQSIARRNAILAGIPKGVARKGYLAVEDVIRGDIKTLVERRSMAIKAFGVMGVTPDRVFAALDVKGEDDITLDHLTTLTGTRSAIKNGELTVEEAFPAPAAAAAGPKTTLTDKMNIVARELAGETVDPETGEVIKQGSSSGNPESASSARGDAQGAEDGATASSAPAVAAKAEPEKKAAAPKNSGPARVDDSTEAMRLADLTATATERAAEGVASLDEFLSGLNDDENAVISPALRKKWRAAAEAADAKRK